MELNVKRAKAAGIDTGAAVAGAVAGLAITNKAADMLTQRSPSLGKHVPALVLAALIGVQALDIVPSSPIVDSAIQGACVVAGMQAVREYSGANTDAGRSATSGLAHLVNQYVPAFENEGQQAVVSASAAVQSAAAANMAGLGNPMLPYRDPARAMWLAGQQGQGQQLPRTLGLPATASMPKKVG